MSEARSVRAGDVEIAVEPHPSLELRVLVASYPAPLEDVPGDALAGLLADPDALLAEAPAARDEDVRKLVRDLLRHGGYRPTGRGKPSSEYLVRASGEGKLASINPAVDAGNLVSLATGFPVSVVDLGRATPPFRVALAAPGASFVFNASGQEIDVSGLLSFVDADGPCANAVKDAQRTKTSAETRRTLSVVWGTAPYAERLDAVMAWYAGLVRGSGAVVSL